LSEARNDGRVAGSSSPNGAYTLVEILSQPLCWHNVLSELEKGAVLKDVTRGFPDVKEWMFIGCGSSYYTAQSAAATMTALTGKRAQAIAASEVLLFPDAVLSARENFLPVLISRSGRTSEVLRAAELLRERCIATLGIGCAPGQPLETLVSRAIVLPSADEQSTVMTRSFTSMLMTLQGLAATIAGRNDFLASQTTSVTKAAEEVLRTLPQRVSAFVNQHDFEDYVALGQGALYGIACETALKLTEMSVSYAQSFHTLEFRHGPKSIVSEETLITFLLSESGYAAEVEVLEEVKKLGGTTLVIANRADERARAAADLLVELNCDAPELARLPLYLLAGQLMGLYTGLEKELDPDNPRNLSRVVVLDEDSPEESTHAAI
jgi:glucosamine--fructose-6-phosphate aminotransferase (isomerizing)